MIVRRIEIKDDKIRDSWGINVAMMYLLEKQPDKYFIGKHNNDRGITTMVVRYEDEMDKYYEMFCLTGCRINVFNNRTGIL